VKRSTIALMLATAAATAVITGTTASSAAPGTAGAGSHNKVANAETVSLKMQASSDDLAYCFPQAKANVNVKLTTDAIGFDTFSIKASGLKPDTAFTVFLIEKAAAPFGHVEYIGDIFTDQYGSADNKFKLIVEEAFAFNNETQDRADLNSVGFWFADPKDDDSCLGKGSPITGFDGDASAGVQMMNSGAYKLP
jgi:hypothetical protein